MRLSLIAAARGPSCSHLCEQGQCSRNAPGRFVVLKHGFSCPARANPAPPGSRLSGVEPCLTVHCACAHCVDPASLSTVHVHTACACRHAQGGFPRWGLGHCRADRAQGALTHGPSDHTPAAPVRAACIFQPSALSTCCVCARCLHVLAQYTDHLLCLCALSACSSSVQWLLRPNICYSSVLYTRFCNPLGHPGWIRVDPVLLATPD